MFDWDAVLNFDGETGPYAQYSARAGVFRARKANYAPGAAITPC